MNRALTFFPLPSSDTFKNFTPQKLSFLHAGGHLKEGSGYLLPSMTFSHCSRWPKIEPKAVREGFYVVVWAACLVYPEPFNKTIADRKQEERRPGEWEWAYYFRHFKVDCLLVSFWFREKIKVWYSSHFS